MLTAHEGSRSRNSCWARTPCVNAPRDKMMLRTLIATAIKIGAKVKFEVPPCVAGILSTATAGTSSHSNMRILHGTGLLPGALQEVAFHIRQRNEHHWHVQLGSRTGVVGSTRVSLNLVEMRPTARKEKGAKRRPPKEGKTNQGVVRTASATSCTWQ
jgi:hypothetical protein